MFQYPPEVLAALKTQLMTMGGQPMLQPQMRPAQAPQVQFADMGSAQPQQQPMGMSPFSQLAGPLAQMMKRLTPGAAPSADVAAGMTGGGYGGGGIGSR